jgi:hypothetical protein
MARMCSQCQATTTNQHRLEQCSYRGKKSHTAAFSRTMIPSSNTILDSASSCLLHTVTHTYSRASDKRLNTFWICCMYTYIESKEQHHTAAVWARRWCGTCTVNIYIIIHCALKGLLQTQCSHSYARRCCGTA